MERRHDCDARDAGLFPRVNRHQAALRAFLCDVLHLNRAVVVVEHAGNVASLVVALTMVFVVCVLTVSRLALQVWRLLPGARR